MRPRLSAHVIDTNYLSMSKHSNTIEYMNIIEYSYMAFDCFLVEHPNRNALDFLVLSQVDLRVVASLERNHDRLSVLEDAVNSLSPHNYFLVVTQVLDIANLAG